MAYAKNQALASLAYAQAQAYPDVEADQTRPASAIAGAHIALEQAQQLSEYVRNVVSRFCGQYEDGQTGAEKTQPPSNGVFHELERHSDATLREIRSAFEAVRHLESQLP